jgi:hypothetical protein
MVAAGARGRGINDFSSKYGLKILAGLGQAGEDQLICWFGCPTFPPMTFYEYQVPRLLEGAEHSRGGCWKGSQMPLWEPNAGSRRNACVPAESCNTWDTGKADSTRRWPTPCSCRGT